MPSFTFTFTINAPIHRVWCALCDPTEVPQWDATVLEALDAPPNYPQPGQHVRWRIARASTSSSSPSSPSPKSGRGPGGGVVLHDHPQHVEPPTRLHSHLTLNRDRLDETYTLTSPDPTTTQLACYVNVSHALPILGMFIARLRTLPQTRAAFETSLANLKRHCEQEPNLPPLPQGEEYA